MKRLIALMLALVMVMLMVAACGGPETTTSPDVTTAPTEATDSTTKTTDGTTGTTGTTDGTTGTTGTTGGTTGTTETPNDPKINFEDYLVMHLDFDEWDIDTNIITDVTGNGHDGKVIGKVDIADGPDGYGDAARFENVGDYIQVADAAALKFSETDSFTVSLWYKLDDNSFANHSWPCLFAKGYPGKTGYYGVWLTQARGFSGVNCGMGTQGSANVNTTATSNLTADGWHHYVAVYDAEKGMLSTYIDGVAGKTASQTFNTTSDADLFIGITGNLDAMQQFVGTVDEFKIYACALDYQTISGIEIEKPDEEKAVVNFDFNEIKDGKFIDSASGLEAVISGDIKVGEGKDGNAVVFDGENELLTIANNDLLNFTKSQNFTIELVYKADANLFKTEDTTGWPCMFQKGAKGTGWYGIWFNKSYIYWGGQAGNYAIESSLDKDADGYVTDNEWHKILIVQNAEAGTITTYIDGVPGKSLPAQDYTSDYDLWIGGKVGESAFQRFVGSIDQFTIYNYAFDEDKIVEGTLYSAAKEVFNYTDSETGETLKLPYRVYYPSDYDENSDKQYPILFFLHGNGECGMDNEQQIKVLGASNILLEDVAAMDNCIIVAPQCVDDNGITKEWIEGEPWSKGIYERAELPEKATLGLRAASALLDIFLASDKVDKDRVYGAGISMGGYGIWELMARRPETFAACVPVCGSGITGSAKDLVNVDIWAFHGDADPTVNISGTKAMYDAITAAGGTKITFTILEGVNHNAWTPAYTTVNADGQTPAQWLLQQTKAD